MQSVFDATAEEAASLHGEVLSKLRRIILDGDFPPGSRIVERLICERLKISRTPLREAFKVLAAEGLVELLPNRGARVSLMRPQDLRETFEVLGALEGLAGELAADRASEDAIAEIRAMHYQMYAHFLRHELPEYFRLNQSIHRRIVDSAGNTVLRAQFEVLSHRVTHARYFANRWDEERWAHAMQEHEAILDCLARRAGTELGAQLRQHLSNKLASLLEHCGNHEPAVHKPKSAGKSHPAKPSTPLAGEERAKKAGAAASTHD